MSVPEEVRFDKQWMVEQIMAINDKVAPIPGIEQHLKTQNASIQKTLETCAARHTILLRNARRVQLLEDAAKAAAAKREANWTRLIGSGLKVMEGLALTFLLMKVLGWV